MQSSISDFEVLKKLGQGSFSCVYKVLRKSDGQEYAMKKVRLESLSQRDKLNALNEIRILASLTSPYIVGYKDAFFDQNENCLFIILEYVGGGDMQQKISYIRKKGQGYFLEEQIIWNYLLHLLQGLKSLHKRGIFHRDIKCANLLLSKDHKHLKLGDLNVAKVVGRADGLAQTLAGTPYYTSPELWQDLPYDGRCDIWSLGCVIYEMANLQPPFIARDLENLQKKIIKGIFDPLNPRYSNDLSNVIEKCLKVNPKERYTIDQLFEMKEIQSHFFLDTTRQIEQNESELLETIHLPKNLIDLKTRLPKPRYHVTDVSCLVDTSNNRTPQHRQVIADKAGFFRGKKSLTPLKRSCSQDQKENSSNNSNIQPAQILYQLNQVRVNKVSSSPRILKRQDSQSSQKKKVSLKKLSDKLMFLIQPILPPISCNNRNENCQDENLSIRKLEIKRNPSNKFCYQNNQNTPIFKRVPQKILIGHRVNGKNGKNGSPGNYKRIV